VYPLLHIQRNSGDPSLAAYVGPLGTSLRTSCILLICTGAVNVLKAHGASPVMYGQRPRKRLQSIAAGELKTVVLSLCWIITMRVLWRTSSTLHFWDMRHNLRSFKGVFVFCFLHAFTLDCFRFKRGGGLITFSRRGIIQKPF
jgi:hypothetical protein